MANGRRGKRGGASRGSNRRNPLSGTAITSGMSPGDNRDIVSQSGGKANTFQAVANRGGLKYGPGSTGTKQLTTGGWIPGWTYAIYGPQGDSSNLRSARKGTPAATIKIGGNTGPTNASVVMPRALGPKGFGGNYRLSKGY
jgi:hypothetical protein